MNASACPSPHSRRLATQWWLRQEKGFGEVLAALVERGIEPLGMNVPVKTAAKRQRPQWRKPRGADEDEEANDRAREVGRAACRERVCQYVEITGGAGSLKKKKK